MAQNTLYFGDNLKILRDSIHHETVSSILDPPLNSKASYNVLLILGKPIREANTRAPILFVTMADVIKEMTSPHSQHWA